jgi:short-subunit dehydrogenase
MSIFKPLNPPLTNWQGKHVWLIGASSGIGEAVAKQLAQLGATVYVSARNETALQALAKQVQGIAPVALDVTDTNSIASAFEHIKTSLSQTSSNLDLVCYCAGTYSPLHAGNFDVAVMHKHQHINYSGAIDVLGHVLPSLIQQGCGHISLVSSVAGFHGLPKALAYGPTKAALINLAECLYLDLHAQGLGVSVINPGFVSTLLTAQNDFAMPALITPEIAASKIIQGWECGTFDIHFPKRFTLWLKLLALLPYRWSFAALKKIKA